MVTIYWRAEDSTVLNYVSFTGGIQDARDFCMKQSVEYPARVYCLFAAENGNESLMSQFQNGQAFVVSPDEILH